MANKKTKTKKKTTTKTTAKTASRKPTVKTKAEKLQPNQVAALSQIVNGADNLAAYDGRTLRSLANRSLVRLTKTNVKATAAGTKYIGSNNTSSTAENAAA